jgi:bacterioferritin
MMQGSSRIVELLNELLTLELTAINQYFLHGKMCQNWGFDRLAKRFRDVAFTEMKDAEEISERILLLEGVPNLQRLGAIAVGENVPEQIQLALETERNALKLLRDILVACDEEGDDGTRVFLEPGIREEEAHVDWLETQVELIRQVGEQNYLAQQIRD